MLGIAVTYLALHLMNKAQPALLYINPIVMVRMLVCTCVRACVCVCVCVCVVARLGSGRERGKRTSKERCIPPPPPFPSARFLLFLRALQRYVLPTMGVLA